MNELSLNDIKRFKLSVGTGREVRSSIDTQRRAYAGKGGRGVQYMHSPAPIPILLLTFHLVVTHHQSTCPVPKVNQDTPTI